MKKLKKLKGCEGYLTLTPYGYDYDCGYDTTIECKDCIYCKDTKGRKNPEAKCNQEKE